MAPMAEWGHRDNGFVRATEGTRRTIAGFPLNSIRRPAIVPISNPALEDRLERNTRTVTLLTFASRVTGLLRDATLARAFGVGPLMDAFSLAFMLPNLFRRLFGEGALSAAFLPVYAELDRDDPERASRVATLVIGLAALVLGVVAMLGSATLMLLSLWVDHGRFALRLMALLLPYMPLVCITALLGAMLQVRGRFGPTAAAPLILNLAMVVAVVAAPLLPSLVGTRGGASHIVVVGGAVLVAGVLQVLWSWSVLHRAGVRWQRPTADARQPFRRIITQVAPMVLGLGILQVNTFVDALIASWPTLIGPTILGITYPLREGALATVGFAQRLYEFPLGVFGIAISTAIFPLLARHAQSKDDFAAILRRGLRLTVFIALPASVGLILVREPLVATILQGGDFGIDDTRRVAWVLAGYAPAIWAYSLNHLLTRASYARGNSRDPVRIAVAMVGLNFVLNITLIWPLAEAGLAWSTAICAIIQSGLLLRLISRDGSKPVDASVRRSWFRTVAATIAMAVAVLFTDLLIHTFATSMMTSPTWSAQALRLALLVAVGGVVVAAVARRWRMPELIWVLGRRDANHA